MKNDFSLYRQTHLQMLQRQGYSDEFQKQAEARCDLLIDFVSDAEKKIESARKRLKPESLQEERKAIAREAFEKLQDFDKRVNVLRNEKNLLVALVTNVPKDLSSRSDIAQILDYFLLKEIRDSVRGTDPLILLQRYNSGDSKFDAAVESSPIPMIPQNVIDATKLKRGLAAHPREASRIRELETAISLHDGFHALARRELLEMGGLQTFDDSVERAASGKGELRTI